MQVKSYLKNIYRFAQHNLTLAADNLKSFRNSNYSSTATDFVNKNNFSSSTPYLIWVDLRNFKTNIFKGSKNNWTLVSSYLCSIGKPSTPTPKGNFKVGIKGLSFGYHKGYVAKYYTQIIDDYLFHSILYNTNGTIKDGRLGMAISNGCVRLALNNAKWIWDNIPVNTSIHIS